MEAVKRYVLVEQYNRDSSMVYDCSHEELSVLLGEMGEMEPIIDAINVLNGASVEQRARDISCSPSDFIDWGVEDESNLRGIVEF